MTLSGTRTSLLLALIALLVGTLESASSYRQLRPSEVPSIDDEHSWDTWREFKLFQEWKRSRKALERDDNESIQNRFSLEEQSRKSVEPPPIDQAALMARFIVNQADWTSVATISSAEDIKSFPFASVVSFSDGSLGNGTGIPYMFLTPLDFTAKDLAHDHRATLLMTLAQGDYCKDKGMDPMDPRCARVYLTGTIAEVKPGSSELEVAKKAVFGRHPWLASMPANHHFFFAKLNIGTIVLLDTFGGPKYIPVADYLNPPTPKDSYRRFFYPSSRNFGYGTDYDYQETKFANRI